MAIHYNFDYTVRPVWRKEFSNNPALKEQYEEHYRMYWFWVDFRDALNRREAVYLEEVETAEIMAEIRADKAEMEAELKAEAVEFENLAQVAFEKNGQPVESVYLAEVPELLG